MFIRPCYRGIKGKRQPYWALVESYRTERGPRQRTVAWLGKLKQSELAGVKRAAEGKKKSRYSQLQLFGQEDKLQAQWDRGRHGECSCRKPTSVRRAWLALELVRRLQLDELFEDVIPRGKEDIPWAKTALVLIIRRLCKPSSELHIAEHYYKGTALPELLGVPAGKINHRRLYEALEKLLASREKRKWKGCNRHSAIAERRDDTGVTENWA